MTKREAFDREWNALPEGVRARVSNVLAHCLCKGGYEERGLIAPDCPLHQYGLEMADALIEADRRAREECATIFDVRAEALKRQIELYGPIYGENFNLPQRIEELRANAAAIRATIKEPDNG